MNEVSFYIILFILIAFTISYLPFCPFCPWDCNKKSPCSKNDDNDDNDDNNDENDNSNEDQEDIQRLILNNDNNIIHIPPKYSELINYISSQNKPPSYSMFKPHPPPYN